MATTTDQHDKIDAIDWDTLKGAINIGNVDYWQHVNTIYRHTIGVFYKLNGPGVPRAVRDLGGNRP